MSFANRASPHVSKSEASSGSAYMNKLQNEVSPLARDQQNHRKNQAADTRDFESERTDDTTVRCAKPWKHEPASIQSRRSSDQEDYAGHDQSLESSVHSSQSCCSDRYRQHTEAQPANAGNQANCHFENSGPEMLQQESD
jgi:hypothetical protein